MRKILLLLLVFFAGGSLAESSPSADAFAAPSATLVMQNRSAYKMVHALWRNGVNCTTRLYRDSPVDINKPNPSPVTVPAGRPMAVGIAIYEAGGRVPVVCDYIVSFALIPGKIYRLEFDVHDRRCFGQLFRQEEGGNFQLITSGSPDGLVERFPEFGWDQFEPGCSSP